MEEEMLKMFKKPALAILAVLIALSSVEAVAPELINFGMEPLKESIGAAILVIMLLIGGISLVSFLLPARSK